MLSTAMIYAMHQIMVACVLRHRGNSVWHERLLAPPLRRAAAPRFFDDRRQGGGQRTLQRSADRTQRLAHKPERARRDLLWRECGRDRDDRASRADAAASDQVLAVFLKEDYSLEPLVAWDTLGMRAPAAPALLSKPAAVTATRSCQTPTS